MFLKDSDSTLDYQIDWSSACAEGSAIAFSSWLVEPQHDAGLAAISHRLSGVIATVRLSGGVAGMLYRVINRVSFADGSTDERSLVVRVEER